MDRDTVKPSFIIVIDSLRQSWMTIGWREMSWVGDVGQIFDRFRKRSNSLPDISRVGWIREFRILLEYLYVLHDRCIFNLAISRKTRPRDETNISKKIISIKLKKKIFRIFQYFENIYNFLEQCRIFLYEWYCNWIKIYIYIIES